MKKHRVMVIAAFLALVVSVGIPVVAQEGQPDKAVVPLSNPAKPAKIEASVLRGSITVKGYDGKDVIVEARVREKSLTGEDAEGLAAVLAEGQHGRSAGVFVAPKISGRLLLSQDEKSKKERSHEGMKQITAAMTGLSVEEDNNVVTVETESWKHAVDIVIQVPVSSSLDLGATNDGSITVENVSGEIEIGNTNGSITIRNASGTVVANTVNGDIEATLNRIASDKPLSFSNMNGDIDVTLPADIKANVKMKSQMGNIYSDFDVVLKATPQKAEEAAKSDKGKYRINFDKGIYGTINGGGPELSFSTFNGNIFIRKHK